MTKKTKLELTWPGKEERPKLEPRILIEDPDKSYRAEGPGGAQGPGTFDNILIKGDNLLALKALERDHTGQIDLIYIDPPFNTGAAFEHYDDGVEHSIWLKLMRERLGLLRRLLKDDGFIAAHIDDSEGHYLKVLMDEVFGRNNYLTTFYVQVRYPQKTLKQDMDFHKEIEMIHIYRKEYGAKPNQTKITWSDEKYCFYFEEVGEPVVIELGGKKVHVFQKDDYKIHKREPSLEGRKEIWATGTILDGNSSGRFFRDYLTGRVEEDGLGAMYKVFGIGDDSFDYRYFTGPKRASATKGKYFQGVPNDKLNAADEATYAPIENFYDMAGSFGNCRHEGGVEFRSGKKPEVLLELVQKHFSNPGDLVLDSFSGSGTTGAVAQKMGRRWIMVEIGEHADTHIVARLNKVINGEDQGGISKAVEWQGGGGFRYYTLAPSLLEKDKWGNWVVAKEYDPNMLVAAMCKHLGFTYAPKEDEGEWWRHGQSSETDFIYVTTQSLTHDALKLLSDEVGPGRSLIICAPAFAGSFDDFENLSCTKIPSAILSRCEWGRDDYSLNVSDPAPADEAAEEEEGEDA